MAGDKNVGAGEGARKSTVDRLSARERRQILELVDLVIVASAPDHGVGDVESGLCRWIGPPCDLEINHGAGRHFSCEDILEAQDVRS